MGEYHRYEGSEATMKDAGNAIQMYQERIERLERALDKCKEQRDEGIKHSWGEDSYHGHELELSFNKELEELLEGK